VDLIANYVAVSKFQTATIAITIVKTQESAYVQCGPKK